MNLLTLKNLYHDYSLKRGLFNYRKSCRASLSEIDNLQDCFSHSYFQSIAKKYSKKLGSVDLSWLASEADKIIKKPYLDITKKNLDTFGINSNDYISFAPYYWCETEENPLSKSSVKPSYKDSRSNPFLANQSDKPKLAQLCARVHLLALASAKYKEKHYIEYIHEQLNIWFVEQKTRMSPNMKYAQIKPWKGAKRGYGIIDSRWIILLLDALVILKYEVNYEVDEGVMSWLIEFADWILTSSSGLNEIMRENNRGSWVDVLLCYIALSVNKQDVTISIIEHNLANRLSKQIGEDGLQPLEMRRYNPVSYSLYNMYPLYYLYNLEQHFNVDDNEREHINRLRGSEVSLSKLITGNEKGKIEHINFCSSYNLNLYYPYSHAQLSNFPCIIPFTENQDEK